MTIEPPTLLAYIVGVIGIGGTVFAIFNTFHKPQESMEKQQALTDKSLDSKATVLAQKEVENKANVLAQQVQWEKEANEKKFAEFSLRLTDAMTMAQNHIHTVDTKVDGLIKVVAEMDKQLTHLATVIEERIPKK